MEKAGELDASGGPVTLDFGAVQFWIPAPIVYLCALILRWHEAGRSIFFINHTECKAFSYLQRIDFFARVGLDLPESFTRHQRGSDFVEIAEVPTVTCGQAVDQVTQRMAACLAGDNNDDARQMAEFSLGEIIANVQQHSCISGFCCAQYFAKHDWARLGVADAGLGMLRSFEMNKAPVYLENPYMSHRDALEQALRPWVSSKKHLAHGAYGRPSNRGIGLNMVHHMISGSCGQLFIATGNSMVEFHGEKLPKWTTFRYPIPGTVVSILFPRANVPAYYGLLSDAHAALNLTVDGDEDRFFV